MPCCASAVLTIILCQSIYPSHTDIVSNRLIIMQAMPYDSPGTLVS